MAEISLICIAAQIETARELYDCGPAIRAVVLQLRVLWCGGPVRKLPRTDL
jgi:hypothetical protein